jgi:hypothetical protein
MGVYIKDHNKPDTPHTITGNVFVDLTPRWNYYKKFMLVLQPSLNVKIDN